MILYNEKEHSKQERTRQAVDGNLDFLDLWHVLRHIQQTGHKQQRWRYILLQVERQPGTDQ
jgi:hypothetical protein